MKKTRWLNHVAGIIVPFLILFSLISCDKTEYELLDPETAGVWTLMDKNYGLPVVQIRDIKLDNNGALWVAFAGRGVGVYKNGDWTFYNVSNSSILSDAVTSLGTKPDGGMLIGTTNGVTSVSSAGIWTSFKDPAVATMNINTITVAKDGTRWLGTESEGFYVDEGAGFYQVYAEEYRNVNAIAENRAGHIFIGTDNGLLKWDGTTWSVLTVASGLPDNDVTALYLDTKDRLWIGTDGGNTVAWMDKTGSLHPFNLLNGDFGTFVRSIYEDKRGHIWFATWFDGLIEYDGVLPVSYKEKFGFYEDDVNCIGEDGSGNLWVGLYSKGLVRYTFPLD